MGKKKKKNNIENAIIKHHKIINKYVGIKSVINSKASIYETTTKSIDGKRPDKRTCIYYDKSDGRCTNKNCSKSYCTTSHNCTGYKRRDKNKINKHAI